MQPALRPIVNRLLGDVPDGVLLERFAQHQDQEAFAQLVSRYNRLVWGQCRGLLASEADAEDAFQATFLVLARSAGANIAGAPLGPWLHGVAYRVCMNARRAAARRARRETAAARPDAHNPVADSAWAAAFAAVAEEVQRLSEDQRTAFILCCLEGRTATDAAAGLGVKLGTFTARLTRARQAVLARLALRGLGAGAFAVGVPRGAAAAPASLVARAVELVPPGVTSPRSVHSLTRGVTGMTVIRSKVLVGCLALVTGLGLSGPTIDAGLTPPVAARVSSGFRPGSVGRPAEASTSFAAGPAVPATADWPLFRGDPLMTGVGTARLPDQLAERWTFKTGDSIEGAPAVAGGVVYVGSFDKHLYALDLATGKEKWKAKLGHIKASPSVKDGRVYVGNLDGKFFCLSAADGKQQWVYETEGEIHSGCNFHGTNVLIGSHDSTLYCLGPDGKKLWDAKTDGPVNGSPVVVGDTTFVAGCDSKFHVLDAKTGKETGAVELDGQAAATAAVMGDAAYVGTMGNQVVAVDWKRGKKLWAFEAPQRQQPFYASAAVTPELVVAGGRDAKVYGIDRRTGKERWHFDADGMVDASPVVVGGRVYVGSMSRDGLFYVLDLKSGRKLQEVDVDGPVTGSAAVGPDCVLVGTDRGTLYCFGAK